MNGMPTPGFPMQNGMMPPFNPNGNNGNSSSPGGHVPSPGQPQQAQGGEGSGANQNAAQQPRPQPKISPELVKHVFDFQYALPPQLTPLPLML
jgi:hypothetical protein